MVKSPISQILLYIQLIRLFRIVKKNGAHIYAYAQKCITITYFLPTQV